MNEGHTAKCLLALGQILQDSLHTKGVYLH